MQICIQVLLECRSTPPGLSSPATPRGAPLVHPPPPSLRLLQLLSSSAADYLIPYMNHMSPCLSLHTRRSWRRDGQGKEKKDKNCGDTKFVEDASGLIFELGPQNFDTSRPPGFAGSSLTPALLNLHPVVMIMHSSEVVVVGFKLKEVLPATLEGAGSGGLLT